MFTQLLADAADPGFWGQYGILLILVAFLAILIVFSSIKRKKEVKVAQEFAENLKVGDKVKTYSGIYGKIISIKDSPNGKVVTIETGEGKNVSYLSVDIFAIYSIEPPKSAAPQTTSVADNGSVEQQIPVEETKTESSVEELEKVLPNPGGSKKKSSKK